MDKQSLTPGLRQAVYAGLTGRAGDVTGSAQAPLRSLLQAAFGQGRRADSVDTRAAAAGLGVTQRTVQRWLAGAERQQRHGASPQHLRAIARRARQAASTQAGRRRALADVRQGALARQGGQLSVRGRQGPRGYERLRRTDLPVDAEQVRGLLDAYERGGDRALVDWLESELDGQYVSGWNISSIEDFELRGAGES